MKSIIKYLIISLGITTLSISSAFAGCDSWFSFSSNCEIKPVYCQGNECSLSGGVSAVSKSVNGLITNKPISQFAQEIVSYFLTFVSLVAVIYIIYAGFQLMIGAGDEEKMKKTKSIILYVIIGIIIMWGAFAIVRWVINLTKPITYSGPIKSPITWSLVPEVSAYTESDADTFRDYQGRIRTAIQNLEAELRVNGTVTAGSIQSIKSLVQTAFDRLPDTGEAATENATAKRAVDMYLDIAANSPNSNQKVGEAISKVSTFIDGAKISSISGDISATPNEGNAPLTVSFLATDVIDPSGTTPGSNNYIWWIRENGGVRREIGRGPSLAYSFTQEGTFTVNLDVISGSRNSKGRTDVLPLSVSKSISVKPKLGEIILLVNGVNVSNVDSIKINPTLGKMGIILDATASRAIGNGSITKTSWDFGNGNELSYQGKPIVERQIYSNQGNYTIQLKITTNDGKEVTKNLQLVIRDPSAVIQLNSDIGHIGEEMHVSALSYFTNTNNVEYSWQIQNDSNQKVLKSAAGNTLNYKFDTIGKYIVTLNARSPNGAIDSDSRTITIESRDPIANLDSPVAISSEKPNTFVFDASKSYDPDTMSKKGITYTWRLDGQKVNLDNPTADGARGTLTFDSIGTHTMSLTVANAHGKVATTEKTFVVESVLSVNMLITPQVAPIGTNITFVARSENADFYEWNFGDSSSPLSGNEKLVQHTFRKTGIYNASLTVSTKEGGKTNQMQRKVYVTDTASPFSIISITNGSSSAHEDLNACGTGAIVVNRSEPTTLDGMKSVNIDGSNSELSYTWSYFGKTKTTASLSEKFGELGCFPVKLTVRSNKNGSTHTNTQYIYLKNQAPELTGISTNVDTTKKDSQKVLVKVSANGAIDPDGVITSYIWYYTTESDKEPQNVQITQRPEITFVLPNITEKYYFGVILEDNDGARTNSADDTNEQTPLILSNQNGNIYMPLITLSTPRTTVLAGEKVHLSAEAKTIVGTNITNKSEYAWDFDGDGKIDKKTQSPSVDHVYQNSGNYTIKVRVTYNGVSNTKYQTIYVKNALKAKVHGYHLPDGGFYFLNASEGIYDKAIWNIGGNSTESLYSTIIEPGLDIENGNVGSLTISSNGTDVNSINIGLSDIEEVTGSGIHYQSSPKAQNDIIHVKGSSDKILLSLLGNSASRYVIDTNTEIDSDLDGITDNDADNKNLASYNDGSVFVMTDFQGTRTREQKIKITLLQGSSPIATKTLTLIFDFIPDSTATASGETLIEVGTGDISTYDRENLDELSSLIRSIDDTNRVILMKEYNILIENWSDSFAKSKTLIDIQTIVDGSAIPADKKSSLTTVINDLLSGDSQATDDITLAAKLIEGLISKSPNAGILSEKLTAIESHPQSLETNTNLAREIFELIQSDSSIDDETKQYIYNQLSVIKSGGSQSVPPESIETPSSGGSAILGFISGVVKVFFLILTLIVVIILIGYILYRVSRKNDAIGFQDFLIDSVFHARRDEAAPKQPKEEEKTSTQSIPRIDALTQEEEKKRVDPMLTLPTDSIQKEVSQELSSPPASLTRTVDATTPTITPPANDVGVPDWLKAPTMTSSPPIVSEPIEPERETETAPIAPQENLTTTILPTIDEATTDTQQVSPPAPIVSSDEAVPDWLKVGNITENIGESSIDTRPIESPVGSPLGTPEPAIPSWLMDSVKQDSPSENEESTNIKKEDTIPSLTPKKSGKKKSTKEESSTTPAPEPDGTAGMQTGDIPDWLK